jgi:NitT/TauT family transport system permease protein
VSTPDPTVSGRSGLALLRPRRLRFEAVASIVVLLGVWSIAALRTEDYIIPPVTSVVTQMVEILTSVELLTHAGTTILRVAVGLVVSFFIGTALGLAMGASRRFDGFSMPWLQISQGVPSLSWVVIAIIWFQAVELRIAFIVMIVTLPGFAFQALDSYRAVPRELRDMARSLRPRRFELFRTVTWPSIVPDLLTAWKVNLGLGTRVVLIAELVGASVGVGYQLLVQQQTFDMAGVVAWTGVLVLFVLLVQYLISRVERRLLRYRPAAMPDQDESASATRKRQPAGA